jgi:hypothetical protein
MAALNPRPGSETTTRPPDSGGRDIAERNQPREAEAAPAWQVRQPRTIRQHSRIVVTRRHGACGRGSPNPAQGAINAINAAARAVADLARELEWYLASPLSRFEIARRHRVEAERAAEAREAAEIAASLARARQQLDDLLDEMRRRQIEEEEERRRRSRGTARHLPFITTWASLSNAGVPQRPKRGSRARGSGGRSRHR